MLKSAEDSFSGTICSVLSLWALDGVGEALQDVRVSVCVFNKRVTASEHITAALAPMNGVVAEAAAYITYRWRRPGSSNAQARGDGWG